VGTRVFTLEPSQIASGGGTATLTESDDQSWVIEKIQVTEDGANDVGGATATISIAGDTVTDQNVDLGAHQDAYADLPPIHLVWPSNNQLEISITNNSGNSVNLSIMLWVRPASDSEVGEGAGAVLHG